MSDRGCATSSSPRCTAATRSRRSTRRRGGTRPSSAARPRTRATTSIVSFGGDGTVNEVANGLAGCPTPLTCLPGGATNVLCKLLGIPGDIVDATEHLLGMADDWRPRRIDLGTANGRAFTYTSGYGTRRQPSSSASRRRPGSSSTGCASTSSSTPRSRPSLRHYLRNPPRMDVHVGGRVEQRDHDDRPERRAFTYLDDKPIALAEGAGLETGSLAGVALRGARPRDVPSVALAAALVQALGRRPSAGASTSATSTACAASPPTGADPAARRRRPRRRRHRGGVRRHAGRARRRRLSDRRTRDRHGVVTGASRLSGPRRSA